MNFADLESNLNGGKYEKLFESLDLLTQSLKDHKVDENKEFDRLTVSHNILVKEYNSNIADAKALISRNNKLIKVDLIPAIQQAKKTIEG